MPTDFTNDPLADFAIRLSVCENVLALLLAHQARDEPALLSRLHEAIIDQQAFFSVHAGPLHEMTPEQWAVAAEQASGRLLSAASAFLARSK